MKTANFPDTMTEHEKTMIKTQRPPEKHIIEAIDKVVLHIIASLPDKPL